MTIVFAMGALTILGIILAVTVLERPQPAHNGTLPAYNVSAENASTDQCRLDRISDNDQRVIIHNNKL